MSQAAPTSASAAAPALAHAPTPQTREARAQALREARRWAWQRGSAAVLALCVLVHLAVMVYAVRGGLSAAEILERTRGHGGFAAFYAVFVVACAVHVPIGLATIAREWWGASARVARTGSLVFALVLLVLGLRTVVAVFMPGT